MGKFSLDVIARLLLILLEGPVKRTTLYYRSGLSYPRLLEYLKFLEERGLIAEKDGAITLTEKGVKTAVELERIIGDYLDL